MPDTTAPPRQLTAESLAHGVQALSAADPDLGAIVRRLGPPPMWGRRPGFATLIRIILEQQVSLAAARTMYLRLYGRLGGVDPDRIARLGIAGLRRLGFTRQKASYCHELATRVRGGELDLSRIARGDDGWGRRQLLEVRGLGPWSVDIYYLMALRRPDVWPSGDLALAEAAYRVKRLPARPRTEVLQRLAERWAPWRSIAARVLWQHYLATRARGSRTA